MANPADAHRKALKKAEKAKNKKARVETRKIATVKSDTRGLEKDVTDLGAQERAGTISTADAERLAESRRELERIKKEKAAFIEAHPDKKHLVFRGSGPRRDAQQAKEEPVIRFTKDGKLVHPERSVYYDPNFNPFGVPPPGMPYKDRSPSDDDSDSGKSIELPDGPPPPGAAAEDSEDEFELPAGPPPPRAGPSGTSNGLVRPPIPTPTVSAPPAIWQQPQLLPQFAQPMRQPPPPGFPVGPAPPTTVISLPPRPSTSTTIAPPAPAPPVAAPSPGPSPFISIGQPAVVAAPQLRDLKREATAFVPQAVKRQKTAARAAAATASSSASASMPATTSIDAAPKQEEARAPDASRAKPSLLGAIEGAMRR